jgi:3-phosphoglycerate kinase
LFICGGYCREPPYFLQMIVLVTKQGRWLKIWNPEEILLLENLRFYKEEEKGDKKFAKEAGRAG